MTEIPMLIIHKLKIRKRKFLLNKGCQFFLYWFCPMTHKNNKLIYVPGNTSSRNHCIVTLEFCFLMLCLSPEILLCPYLSMQMGIVDERKAFFCRIFNHLWS